jgi:nucleoside-diphosphate-sugar epimerase
MSARVVVTGPARRIGGIVRQALESRYTLIPDSVVATANVYEAARRGGVRRMVFFSSMPVGARYETDPPWSRIATGDYAGLDPAAVPLVTAAMPTRPDGPYAVSKIVGESPGQYYAEAHGEVVLGASDNTWKIDDTPRARTVLGYAPRRRRARPEPLTRRPDRSQPST